MDITLAALLVTAGATVILAFVTWRLVAATKRLVHENERIIAAAEQQAAASTATVGEIKRDRELGYRPHPTFEITYFTAAANDADPDMVHLVNYGRGPALNAFFCERLDGSWRRTLTFDLSPDLGSDGNVGDLPVRLRPLQRGPTPAVVDALDPHGVHVAIFCQDQLGNAYRFGPRVTNPDVWRPGEPPTDWAIWYETEKYLD